MLIGDATRPWETRAVLDAAPGLASWGRKLAGAGSIQRQGSARNGQPWHGGPRAGQGKVTLLPMNSRIRLGHRPWLLPLMVLWVPWAAVANAAGASVAAEGPDAFSWFQFLAPFHMVVLHLPIGLFAAVMVLEGWTWMRPSGTRREVIGFLLGFGVVATAVTMALGFLRATDGEYEALTLGRHRGWGIAAGVLITVSWGLHRHGARHPAPGGLVAFRCLLATGFVAMAVAGHHGGTLTHGSALLTEHAPGALRRLLQSTASKAAAAADGNGLGPASAGFAAIQPVLAAKCVGCHGPEKQKGGLRLDTRELAMKPGKSGRASVVAGDPARSEVVRVLLLDAAHDEAMPPEGKERLTDAELGRVVGWVRDGAR